MGCQCCKTCQCGKTPSAFQPKPVDPKTIWDRLDRPDPYNTIWGVQMAQTLEQHGFNVYTYRLRATIKIILFYPAYVVLAWQRSMTERGLMGIQDYNGGQILLEKLIHLSRFPRYFSSEAMLAIYDVHGKMEEVQIERNIPPHYHYTKWSRGKQAFVDKNRDPYPDYSPEDQRKFMLMYANAAEFYRNRIFFGVATELHLRNPLVHFDREASLWPTRYPFYGAFLYMVWRFPVFVQVMLNANIIWKDALSKQNGLINVRRNPAVRQAWRKGKATIWTTLTRPFWLTYFGVNILFVGWSLYRDSLERDQSYKDTRELNVFHWSAMVPIFKKKVCDTYDATVNKTRNE